MVMPSDVFSQNRLVQILPHLSGNVLRYSGEHDTSDSLANENDACANDHSDAPGHRFVKNGSVNCAKGSLLKAFIERVHGLHDEEAVHGRDNSKNGCSNESNDDHPHRLRIFAHNLVERTFLLLWVNQVVEVLIDLIVFAFQLSIGLNHLRFCNWVNLLGFFNVERWHSGHAATVLALFGCLGSLNKSWVNLGHKVCFFTCCLCLLFLVFLGCGLVCGVELGIDTVHGDELVVSALLGNPALFHDNDVVR